MSLLLRTLIKNIIAEVLEASDGLSELEKGSIRDELRKARMFRRTQLDVDSFVELEDNIDDWRKILSHGSIKYLGSGRQGSAFALGSNKVLKLEPGAPRAAEIEDALYSGTDVGAGLPNVINTGIFDSAVGPIGWSIIEKVQAADEIGNDPDWKVLWKAISDGIQAIVHKEQKLISDYEKSLKKKGMKPQEISAMRQYAIDQGLPGSVPLRFVERSVPDIVKGLKPLLPQDLLFSIEERYRLSPDWFNKFIKGVQSHYKLGMVDFKPENMGIRRVRGGEGEVIFFDAASAKLRDIKKWEPKL